ncbi:hypothetical protein RY831_27905 [Noviherbaspirillum sp. CPCC 100848]|uniref:Uncharacterized protein n=1 Tax=Noviherbaspirillum album TaxID=3080276 RepID=A0ABU6JH50_9BURK|nr:hypothetical protein [Noviherbaspirillum sp. CPCC 100848]MEC4722989.1 hypothetical protein [Noviherbaspirillum sp. CPCC 100848]
MPVRARSPLQTPAMPRAHGFFVLKMIISVMVIGAVALPMLDRLRYYQEVAEQAYVDYAISGMRSGLRLRIAAMMLEGRGQEAYRLAGENPVDWLERRPDNYAGELIRPDPDLLRPGTWYFDLETRRLIYLVKHGDHFRYKDDGQAGGIAKTIELQARLVGPARAEEGEMPVNGASVTVALQKHRVYEWIR